MGAKERGFQMPWYKAKLAVLTPISRPFDWSLTGRFELSFPSFSQDTWSPKEPVWPLSDGSTSETLYLTWMEADVQHQGVLGPGTHSGLWQTICPSPGFWCCWNPPWSLAHRCTSSISAFVLAHGEPLCPTFPFYKVPVTLDSGLS